MDIEIRFFLVGIFIGFITGILFGFVRWRAFR